MFQFWYRWLIILAWLVIVFGLEMVFLNQTVLFEPINHQLNMAFWGTTAAPAAMIAYQQLMYAALGATTLGWGVMLLFLLRNAFARRERWAWWAIVVSIDVWYVLDSVMAWQYGAYAFVIVNTLLVLAAAPALIATRKALIENDTATGMEWAGKAVRQPHA